MHTVLHVVSRTWKAGDRWRQCHRASCISISDTWRLDNGREKAPQQVITSKSTNHSFINSYSSSLQQILFPSFMCFSVKCPSRGGFCDARVLFFVVRLCLSQNSWQFSSIWLILVKSVEANLPRGASESQQLWRSTVYGLFKRIKMAQMLPVLSESIRFSIWGCEGETILSSSFSRICFIPICVFVLV